MAAAVAGTVREALEGAMGALEAAGVDGARLDAELLLAEALGLDRARLAADPRAGVPAQAARRFGEMVRRRVAREPVAYILGRKGFRHIELAVDRRVLIPRPETELLVELAVELGPRSVLDVGTGSGAVALAVAAELPQVTATGVDTSPGALAVARANAEWLGLAARVRIAERTGGTWDLVLANLPYVPESDWDTLEPEIRGYEPREALIAGPTGLEAIDELLGAISLGSPSAEVVGLEVGMGQAVAVAELVRRAGFEQVETRRDLAGIERMVVGRRP